ncbi:MAG: LysM peptidoglycan-binding domain-containing protein [Deltaproteobacteria bacterium]|nr:LysM peptidoglycan-binding domain-containing protein [Deltaproteobacteria bacterium]
MSGFARIVGVVALACIVASARAQAAGPSDPFPEPEGLSPAVAFWTRVYLDSTTDGGFLHDARELAVVYELLRFDGERNSRRREAIVERAKDRWRAVLERLAAGEAPRDDAERALVRGFEAELGRAPVSRDFRAAKERIRFQLGQRDKFRQGVIVAGGYEAEMRAHFRERSMPEDLAYLPHVESSFNVHAYSKYGAAGIWQFMRGTGKRFMKVDYVVDERLDPVVATEAAARLLRENYAVLGNWPLALTAYNHGAAGMNRAVKKLGTSRIDVIVERYDAPSFGFASRNFYAQFLAARRILGSYETYLGPLQRDEPRVVDSVTLPFYADVADLERNLGVSRETIAELNPALRPPVFRSGKRIPKGYTLRLPAGTVVGDASTWIAAVPKQSQHARQHENRYYTVRRGDTLGGIAQRHGTSVAALAAENDVGARRTIYPGQVLQIPDRSGASAPVAKPGIEIVRTAEAATLPEPKPEPAPAPAPEPEPVVVAAIEPAAAAPVPAGAPGSEDFLRVEGDRVIVEAGETLGHFADWLQVTPQHLVRLNKLRPRRPIQVGQSLRLDFAKVTPDVFQQRRLEYHKGIEEDFFGSFRVANTLEHKLKPGETLWLLSHKKYAVPGWLIRRYNPDVDLGKLVPGVVLVIPIVEKVG